MPNYAIYCNLTTELAATIQCAVVAGQEKFAEFLAGEPITGEPVTEAPHITIAYGPEIDDSEEESVDVDSVYPGLRDVVQPITQFVPKNVDYFTTSDGRRIIKLTVVSEDLDLLRKSVREHSPLIDARARAFEDRDGCTGAAYQWAHITLAILKPDVPEETLLEVLRFFNAELSELLWVRYTAASISLLTAKTDTVVPIVVSAASHSRSHSVTENENEKSESDSE